MFPHCVKHTVCGYVFCQDRILLQIFTHQYKPFSYKYIPMQKAEKKNRTVFFKSANFLHCCFFLSIQKLQIRNTRPNNSQLIANGKCLHAHIYYSQIQDVFFGKTKTQNVHDKLLYPFRTSYICPPPKHGESKRFFMNASLYISSLLLLTPRWNA